MLWKKESHRNVSGGIRKEMSKKKRYMRCRDFLPTMFEKEQSRKKTLRTLGGNKKEICLIADKVIVSTGSKAQKTNIVSVIENRANAQYTRMGVITKGALIKTEIGLVKVTSRPGQNGVISAVLVQEKDVAKK